MAEVLLITGVSSGLGRAMAHEALSRGDVVVGTVRKREDLEDYEATAPGRSIGRLFDVADTSPAARRRRTGGYPTHEVRRQGRGVGGPPPSCPAARPATVLVGPPARTTSVFVSAPQARDDAGSLRTRSPNRSTPLDG